MVVENEQNGAGMLVGGLLGGVAGHQFGKGNGKTALTVLGAVVGAAAGSQVTQTQKTVIMNEFVVQKQDGNTVIITVQDTGFVKGQRVLMAQQGNKVQIQAIH